MLDIDKRMDAWLVAVEGPDWKSDPKERRTRFLEEGIELYQTLGFTKDQIVEMIDRVYVKEAGEFEEEVAGTFLTLMCLCMCYKVDLLQTVSDQLEGYERRVEEFKIKHPTKVRF